MKKLPLLFTTIILNQFAFSQAHIDSIFTSNGIIAVNIKEITEDAIKFSYPEEDLVNSIYKNTVFKIKHKSGRVETFNESTSFKVITGGEDWEKVSLTRVESETKGLFKLEEVTSKATGTTVFSNVNLVKDRAFKKLKIEAALLGANMIYIIEQQTQGVTSGFGSSSPARTNLSGVAYTNKLPNFNDFSTLLKSKSEFEYLEHQYLSNNSTDLVKSSFGTQKMVKITEAYTENGFILVKANLKGENTSEYRVTYFDEHKIILMYRDKAKIYNFILKI